MDIYFFVKCVNDIYICTWVCSCYLSENVWPSKTQIQFGGPTFFMFLFCLVFAMSLCASVYMYFVVTCWERADLLALVCGVYCEFVTFPLVSWVRCGTWLYRFLIFAPLLTITNVTTFSHFPSVFSAYLAFSQTLPLRFEYPTSILRVLRLAHYTADDDILLQCYSLIH